MVVGKRDSSLEVTTSLVMAFASWAVVVTSSSLAVAGASNSS